MITFFFRLVVTFSMNYQRSRHAVYLLNYHFIFVPRYRRKTLFGTIKDRLTLLFKEYAQLLISRCVF
ncbi:MAG: transposase [Promethearchaeota archaeon]